MSEWRDKPWYLGRPSGIVLYSTPEDGWRFALITERKGIVDGRIGRPELDESQAKAEVLRRLLESEKVILDGHWRSDKPGWWSADLKPDGG